MDLYAFSLTARWRTMRDGADATRSAPNSALRGGLRLNVFVKATNEMTATFTGRAGSTYGFYSIAIDAAGNEEAPKGGAETLTRLVGDTMSPVTQATLQPEP